MQDDRLEDWDAQRLWREEEQRQEHLDCTLIRYGEGAVHVYGADDEFMFKAEGFEQAKGRLDQLNATKRGRRASGSSGPPRGKCCNFSPLA
jgi:hypothetical protein